MKIILNRPLLKESLAKCPGATTATTLLKDIPSDLLLQGIPMNSRSKDLKNYFKIDM